MAKKMLIDATHPEETRVAIVEGNRLLEFDYESKFRKPLKGSIFLAKVTRVEPSLQAAFVNFGGNRHGFLPFNEIHPDYFRIPIADREALLAEQQQAMEEYEEMEREEDRQGQGDYDESGYADNGDKDSAHADDGDDGIIGDSPVETVEDNGLEDIEELGGALPGATRGRNNHRNTHRDNHREDAASFLSADDSADHLAGEMEMADDISGAAHRGDSEGSLSDEHGEASEAGDENGEEGEGDEGRGRGRRNNGGRYQRRGRGRGRGRHRMAYGSRRVESFGGEDRGDPEDRFRYNLRRRYKIQEVIKRGQIMLVQVSKEERGNKGAAVTSYLSLPGRYSVLMPNSPRGGGVSRKIASYQDRARMRDIIKDLGIPQGMSVIVRTAGVSRSQEEISRDLDYLMRLWDNIRDLTLQSSAPALVYEEADLIKRAVRDLYSPTIDQIVVSGQEGYETARNFMTMLVPDYADHVVPYTDADRPLFHKFRVEDQIVAIGESQVTLPSGGYLVINQTEALVAIDVNSGKATKERHIEETALKTNLEAAQEVARQLRLRDLGGLVVIDFIDMEDRRNNARVERRMRDALSTDRARIQMSRISSFGLMELSRQRLNPSLTESQFEQCPHCRGVGRIRTADATSIMVLRALEEEGLRRRSSQAVACVSNAVALYILNNKRTNLEDIQRRYGLQVLIRVDDTVGASSFRIETVKGEGLADDESEVADTPDDLKPYDESEFPNRATISDRADRPERAERSDRERGGERGNGDRSGERSGGRRRGRRGGRRRNGRERGPDGENLNGAPHNASPDTGFDPGNAADYDNQTYGDQEGDDIGNRHGADYHARTALGDDLAASRGGRGRMRSRAGRGGGGGRSGGGGPRGESQRHDRPRGENRRDNPNPDRDGNSTGSSNAPRRAPEPSFESSLDIPSAQHTDDSPVARRPQAVPAPGNDHARNFETVNEEPQEKKRGWWSRFSE